MNVYEYTYDQRISSFITAVYGWMSCALTLTALAAYYIAATPELFAYIYSNPGIILFLFFAQIMLVVVLSFFLMRMSFATALVMFLVYALLLGITLSSIFFVYTQASIVSTFLTTALMFGTMSLYGYITRTDLTTIGNMAIMALFGLIIGLVVNIFMQNPQVDLIISAIGVIIFVILTAYDTQKIKQLGQQLLERQEVMKKISILGALTLYLDFINLFLFLLRFMGRRRED